MLKRGRENIKFMQKNYHCEEGYGLEHPPEAGATGERSRISEKSTFFCQHRSYMPVIQMCKGQSKISASSGLSTGWRQSRLLL